MNDRIRPLTWLLTVSFFVLFTLGAPSAVQADGLNTRTGPDDPPTLLKHLRTELQHKDPMRREHALMDVIVLSNCPASCTLSLYSIQGKKLRIENESGKGSLVDLTALLPELVESYRKSPDDTHRIMALSAIVRIGDESTLEQIVDESAYQSASVKKATNLSLAAFYLMKYPELAGKTEKTGLLSLEDVQKAKSVRVRLARKVARN